MFKKVLTFHNCGYAAISLAPCANITAPQAQYHSPHHHSPYLSYMHLIALS